MLLSRLESGPPVTFHCSMHRLQKAGDGAMKTESQSWNPVWTTMPMASKACSELLKCRCQREKGCSGRCACKKQQ